MNKIDLLYGFFIGIATAAIGSYFFVTIVTNYTFSDGVQIMRMQGNLGKLITLGAILNLIVFFLLLRFKKDLMARGVVLAMIVLTIVTLLV